MKQCEDGDTSEHEKAACQCVLATCSCITQSSTAVGRVLHADLRLWGSTTTIVEQSDYLLHYDGKGQAEKTSKTAKSVQG